MKRLKRVSALFSGVLAFSALTDAFAYNYVLTDIGTLGGTSSSGAGINNNGWVTGESVTADGYTHAFLYDGTTIRDLGTLGGTDSYGTAINSNGWITGSSYFIEGSYERHAFIYDGNSMRDIGTLSGVASSYGTDINDNGLVVGNSGNPFLYDGTTMQDLGDLGYQYGARISGINNNGMMTGTGDTDFSFHDHAILYDGTTVQDLSTLCGIVSCLGNYQSRSNAINDLGWIAGEYLELSLGYFAFISDGNSALELDTVTDNHKSSYSHDINNQGWVVGSISSYPDPDIAFLYDGNSMLDLCVLTDCTANGWDALTSANGINDHGDITGEGIIGGETHAFILRAVPIPSAGWLFGSGVLGLIGIARRKKDILLLRTETALRGRICLCWMSILAAFRS